MAAPEKFTPDEMIKAIKKHHGLVYLAAKTLKCHSATIYDYARRYPEIREAIDEQRGLLIDVAEDKLLEAINKREGWAIALVLKTLGKNRGYIERAEQQHEGEITIRIVRDDANPNDPA